MHNLRLSEFHTAVVLIAQIHQSTSALEAGASELSHAFAAEIHDK